MLTRTVRTLLAEQYSDMLAQDYRLRNMLLSSYHHDFSSLLQFDQRIQAYLDGMLLLKEETTDTIFGGNYRNCCLQENCLLSRFLRQMRMMNFFSPGAWGWCRGCPVSCHHFWP